MFKPGDYLALAGQIERIYGDRDLAESMGRAGRERVLRVFTAEAVADRLSRIYGEVVGR